MRVTYQGIRFCRRPARRRASRWAGWTIRTLWIARRGMYRSSYGPTIDGLQKPELIAPGIWVAAPILPSTPTAEEAELYSQLNGVGDEGLRSAIDQHAGIDKDLDEARSLRIPLLRQLITMKLREG